MGVFVYHGHVLAGPAPDDALLEALIRLAALSIEGFFIVSGALVFGSLERSGSLASYAGKRVRRLYPAYAAVILLAAVASLVVTGGGDLAGVARYLGANLVFLNFLEPTLPGLFTGNPHTEVNGALWTLKIEVMFYIALPVIGWLMTKFGTARWAVIGLIYAGGEAWRIGLPLLLDHPFAPAFARQLPGQMAFFASGMALWLVWDRAKAQPGRFGLAGAGLLALSFAHPVLEPLRAAGLAGLIAFAAFQPGPKLDAARFGDISYGVYITHFPVLQALIAAGAYTALTGPGAFALAVALVLVASFLLWHLVERPALRRDSHYRRVEAAHQSPFPSQH